MDEIATDPSPPLIETPVVDNALFLLHEHNRDFLNGTRDKPILRNSGSPLGVMVVVFLGLSTWVFWWVAERARDWRPIIDIDVPSIPTAWMGEQGWLFALFGVLAVIGVLVVLNDIRYQQKGTPTVTPAKALEAPVVRAKQSAIVTKPKGLILTGQVVQAEKIRREGRYVTQVKIGVRYRFAAPGGVLTEGRAEGDILAASHDMAPLPGTPVRVWYTDNERFYLL